MKKQSHTQKHLSSVSELIPFIPDWIYCCDDYSKGVYRHNKNQALKRKHIQINTWKKSTLLFDIDQGEWSPGMWTDFGFQPTWVTINKETGNCHCGYVLIKPIICNHPKPVDYFTNVQYAMNYLLNGDSSYPGLITKNPFHSSHQVFWFGNLYDLKTLAGASIPFAPSKPKRQQIDRIDLTQVNDGERNVSMFHEVRAVAYVEVRKFRGINRIYNMFYENILQHAVNMNYCLIEPITLPEVKTIATSVAQWTFAKDPQAEERFRKRQSARGRKGAQKGGINSGINRRIGSIEEQKPWEGLGISRRTYYNWKRVGKLDTV